MPHYTNNNILVVTYDELVPRFYKSVVYLCVALDRAKKRGFGLKRVARGHNGGQALILFDSLPEKIRTQMDDPRVGRHVLESFFEVDGEAVNFYQSFRFGDGRSISEGNDEGERDLQGIYVCNASVIKAVMKLKTARINEIITKGHRPKKIWETLCNDVTTFKSVLKRKHDLECNLPPGVKRFEEKCKKFMEKHNESAELGYMYLISEKHGNANSRKVDETTLAVLESLFATQIHKPNYTEVADTYNAFLSGYAEVINNETGEFYDPKQFKPLSDSTINNYLCNWQSSIGTFGKRSGDRQRLMAQFKPAHKMTKSEFAGSLVSVDDRQPPFEYASGQRAWFYLGIDDASECYISWVHGKDKKGMIGDFYRQMVRNCHQWGVGIPMELEAESNLNSTMKDGLLLPGNMFEYVRIEANNARGKIIERYFQYMRYQQEKSLPGWIGRPFARKESNQAGAKDVPLLPYEHIVQQTLSLIQQWNNSPHSVHTDKTRWEVFLERQNPKIKPINWRGIVPYIGYKTASSCRVGEVKLQGGAYLLGDNGEIYLGERLINLMKLVEGEKVDVYWLDDNDGNVMKAYAYIGNQFICELLPKPSYKRARAEQTDNDLLARQLMSSYVATIEAYGKRKRQAIETVTVIDNRTPVLNTKFQIHGLKNKVVGDQITADICTSAFSDDVQDVVVMPDVPDDDFNCELVAVETEVNHKSDQYGFGGNF
jgi:hypothetical protein